MFTDYEGAVSDSEIIEKDDVIRLFLADETISKFQKEVTIRPLKTVNNTVKPDILYEDEDILLVNKPVGILSQKAKPQDISMNEILLDYLMNTGMSDTKEGAITKPSVCNRLDRNTSGILTFGKTLRGTQMLSRGLKMRTMDKYYVCVVSGVIKDRQCVDGYLIKDTKSNKVVVKKEHFSNDAERIVTEYMPISDNGTLTFLKIKLHTGKTHQIRAHLASVGHPLIGDYKYGNNKLNDRIKKQYKIESQMLHAFELYIPEMDLRTFAPIPLKMQQFLKGEQLWEPGNQEDLEALH